MHREFNNNNLANDVVFELFGIGGDGEKKSDKISGILKLSLVDRKIKRFSALCQKIVDGDPVFNKQTLITTTEWVLWHCCTAVEYSTSGLKETKRDCC